MSNWGDVVFTCRKCGKEITRPSAKRGYLFSCGSCGTVQRSPGIATQLQATAEQLAIIRRSMRCHLMGLILGPCTAVLCIFLTPFALAAPSSDLGKLVMVSPFIIGPAAGLFMLCMETGTIESLGGSTATSFVFFFFLGPIWLVRSIISIVRVYFHLERLTNLGTRE
jgi:hypothetical protein